MKYIITIIMIILTHQISYGKQDTVTYHLTLDQKIINIGGVESSAMVINDQIPGPTLRFTEGDFVDIHVKNNMPVESSVHWHGLLLPNFFDGVPYLTTPPIKPGATQIYTFPLRQAGTYWYHSHTGLQEQMGIYGSIIIEPKEKTLKYDKDLVLVLSDWTNQKPKNVLRNLKRGNEWYNIKKGTATPLNQVIGRGAFGAQLNFWKQRMEGADIADIYYNEFLINGQPTFEYPNFKPGEKVRVRFINAAASSQFWVTFGGETPLLVASDGLDVVPISRNKTFIAIAETYDFIVTLPESGKIEIKATVQDGSGHTAAALGEGNLLTAPEVHRPDKIKMMQQMASMKMRMGAPSIKFNSKNENPSKLKNDWGMQMQDMEKDSMDHSKMKMNDKKDNSNSKSMNDVNIDYGNMDYTSKMEMKDIKMLEEYNYDYLKSPNKTTFSSEKPVKDILLNLTGNMQRYIWSINGVPLSETDKIKIKQGEVARITLNNLTMMYHPMHLHGHFFRVINENGEYSPLKHTVNVAPMQKVTIEFDANEYGDWFFHCHVLYHMMSGMARVFSYDTERDPRMVGYALSNLTNEGKHLYNWGTLEVASHMTELNLVSSNTRNQLMLMVEFGWNNNIELELTYERFLYDYFSLFVGANLENETEDSLDETPVAAIGGFRFLTPYMFDLEVRTDNKLRPQISLSREIMIFPRTILFANYEYQADLGWVKDENSSENYSDEITWSVGLEYFLSRNLSIMGSYDNRFGAGGGLLLRF